MARSSSCSSSVRGMERQGVQRLDGVLLPGNVHHRAYRLLPPGTLHIRTPSFLPPQQPPPSPSATGLSVRLTGRMNEKVFRQAVVAVIVVTSTLVLAREVFSL